MARVLGIDKFMSSKPFLKAVKFASDNPVLFASATTFGLSAIVRPVVIFATPKTNKEDKKYAIAKSLTSSAVGLGLSFAVSKPVEKAIKTIDNAPKNFLKPETIKYFKGNGDNLLKSQKYLFATQFFKTATGFLSAIPKTTITCAVLPFVADAITPKREKSERISFSGKNSLANGIGKVMNTGFIKNFTNKFSNTNLVQNTAIATDILLTASFANKVRKSDKIPDENKKPLINNSFFSTGLSILTYSGLNKLFDKPTEKFINKFLEINKGLKNQKQYIQGIKAMKTVFVMGGVYYAVIPFLSTLFAGIVKNMENKAT